VPESSVVDTTPLRQAVVVDAGRNDVYVAQVGLVAAGVPTAAGVAAGAASLTVSANSSWASWSGYWSDVEVREMPRRACNCGTVIGIGAGASGC
jgi:hypothetical protein